MSGKHKGLVPLQKVRLGLGVSAWPVNASRHYYTARGKAKSCPPEARLTTELKLAPMNFIITRTQ